MKRKNYYLIGIVNKGKLILKCCRKGEVVAAVKTKVSSYETTMKAVKSFAKKNKVSAKKTSFIYGLEDFEKIY